MFRFGINFASILPVTNTTKFFKAAWGFQAYFPQQELNESCKQHGEPRSHWNLNRTTQPLTEWQGLEGTSVGHFVQPPCRSRVTYSRLHRPASRQVLNISREGDSNLTTCFTVKNNIFLLSTFTWIYLSPYYSQ